VEARGFAKWLAAVAFFSPLLALAQNTQQPADVPAPVELRFDIDRYLVDGNTLLSAEDLDRLTAPYAGKGRDFGDVQRALEALENAYRDKGYSTVQVFLPEQDLEKGQVILRVIEARIRKLEITGNKFFDEANIRQSLPSMREGTVPNADAIAANLRVVNESPAKQTNVVLRATDDPAQIDARVDITDDKPDKWFLTLDNTGGKSTGYWRAGIGYQTSNLWNLDHSLTLQYVTSDKEKMVHVWSIGYRVPLYSLGASVDFIAGFSDVEAGTTETTAGELKFSGKGEVYGVRYNHHLPRVPGLDHRVIFGVDYKDYKNTCTLGAFGAAGCGTAAASFVMRPASVAYTANWTLDRAQAGVQATYVHNLPGGADGNTDAINRARPGADPSYSLWRFAANYARAFESDWQARVNLQAQHSEQILVGAEQFGAGGQTSVRGFNEREISAERGYFANFEIYTPDVGERIGLKAWNIRFLGFFDTGYVQRVDPAPGDIAEQSISSVGFGVRAGLGKSLSLKADLANTLNDGGARRRGSWRLGLSGVVTF
jgi:hemolysin activation/secretion protein